MDTRWVDSYETEDEAWTQAVAYAAMLRERGLEARYGVFARRLPSGGWTVLLRDREPHEAPLRLTGVVPPQPQGDASWD